ncbi:MAG: class I SAM-dependent methyltransferase, partial [Anaerolineae bacterium]|nr:class I SAM-dependent methyltransferase [Anaerolineae bacterium]
DVLASGGIFINADQMLGTSAANEQIYQQAWEATIRKQGSTAADIHAANERMKADQTSTLEDQLRWLREAGFADVDCWYKRYRFAVYSGRKP